MLMALPARVPGSLLAFLEMPLSVQTLFDGIF